MLESLRDIRLFVAAYEERSFTAAAQREGATQSGVSQHIRKIEDRFGLQLFSRATGEVRPTPAADSYYRHCINVLRSNEAATRALQQFDRGLGGEIVIGLMPTLTRCVMAPALATFMKEHPNVGIRINEGFSPVLTAQVQAGAIDFAIVPATTGATGIRSRLFMATPEVLVSKGGRGLPDMAPVSLSELGPLKVVVPSPKNTRHGRLHAYFSSHNVQIDRLLELDAMMGTLDLVANTDWVTILPGIMMAKDIGAGQYFINPLARPKMETELVLIEPARRPLSEPAQAFLSILGKEARRLNDRWHATHAA